VWASATQSERATWRAEYEKWAALQRDASVGGIVFDYDGTICEIDERYTGPGVAMADALTRILETGLKLGVASGRGRSVIKALQALLPEKYWERVIVGPYNGGLVMSLADPYPTKIRSTELMRETGKLLAASPLITALADISYSGPLQVTLVEKKPYASDMLRRVVLEALATEQEIFKSVSVESSGLAIDIIGPGASKRRVADHMAANLDASQSVFAIGDQGSIGGNDFTLLADSHALSVYRVSSRLDQCWNVARPGRRGSVAFMDYLSGIIPRDGSHDMFRFDIDSFESA
jgi:hydroxymethylpyrimidine pyrophosphatase-like HAD family hydrolase